MCGIIGYNGSKKDSKDQYINVMLLHSKNINKKQEVVYSCTATYPN